jgi:hypothetical protein
LISPTAHFAIPGISQFLEMSHPYSSTGIVVAFA